MEWVHQTITLLSKRYSPELVTTSSPENDVEDDGSPQNRGDGIERNQSSLTRQQADEVAEQGNGTTHHQGEGKQRTMIGCAEHETGNVGHSQTDERYRTAERSGDCREQPRNDK